MRRLSKKILVTIIISSIILILLFTSKETSVWLRVQRKEDLMTDLIFKLETEITELRKQLSMTELASHVMSACDTEATRQLRQAHSGQRVSHEWELAPSSLFTSKRVFPAEPGIGGRVIEKIMGPRRNDLVLVIAEAIKILDSQAESQDRYDAEDFVEGNFRSETSTGIQYELIFKNKSDNNKYTKLYLQRPYAPINFVSMELNVNKKQLIHIILPLSGRLDSFKSFMERFYKISQYDGYVFLTVVYFGLNNVNETKDILDKYKENGNPNMIVLNEPFSRAKALRVGASQPPLLLSDTQDLLLFFCDVDVVFTSRFVERCRWNTSPGKQVFYPIVFSLYNPRVVYKLHGKQIPPENEQLIISKHSGFWRDFGYGMTCQYRSDFLQAYEPSFERTSWGGEDVALYRKFLREPNIQVLRTTDPSIFHLWHDKRCEPRAMSPSQLRSCLHSRARNEASHAQLGLLAFKDYQNYVWRRN